LKQVIARGGDVTVAEVPQPVCGVNDVLVRTAFSVISTGTETWAIDSTNPLSASDLVSSSSMIEKATRLSRDVLQKEGAAGLLDYAKAVRNPEIPLGYSSAGVVMEVGRNVKDVLVGDKMACAGEGKACHAEVVSVPRNLAAKVPEGLSMKDAAFSTIGAIAIHAVRTASVQIGETVGVIGAGLVGNLVAQLAKAAGCKVVCLDLREDRLALVKELGGADLTLRVSDPAIFAHVLHFTRGRGLDHVMVCAATSNSDPLNLAARIARNRGRVVVVGRVGMDIERKDFFQKELTLLMSRSLGPGRYDPIYEDQGVDYPLEYVRWTLNRNMESFMDTVADGKVVVDKLVGGEFQLASATDAYASLTTQSKTAVLLSYERAASEATTKKKAVDDEVASSQRAKQRKTERPHPYTLTPITGRINVALVGPGNFAKETLIPVLRAADKDFNLRWVVSSNPLNATKVAKRYRFEKSTCDYDDVLTDPEMNLVVIASPNNLHFPMLRDAMSAGKLALVEKPLCVTRDEFEEVKRLHSQTGMPVIVGFNRRYAPLVLKMKEAMKGLDGPFFITYRVNAGFVAASRWSQDPSVGGGRIIHECCHFFDLFNFLLLPPPSPGQPSSPGPEIMVQSAGINGSTTVSRDNIAIALKYPGGSLANLVYVATGSKDMDRERIEVFAQGTSMVIDDFRELNVYGEKPETVRLSKPEKGHANEFAELVKLLRGTPSSIISTEEVYSATELTLRVDEAARNALVA
jgi:predicted dehydrogenase/threonine dehydrogenase-like Zn-dependent dehydrogenase